MASVESINLKIKEIEDEMSRTQKNKATNQHMGLLKAKIAKLKRQLVDGPAGGGGGGKGDGFDVNKSGDARIGLVGFPSVGKSTLLQVMTGTFSEVAAYEFTTLTCIPGIIRHEGAKLQMLDLPGIIEGAADGKGRGRQVIATARTCNVIVMVLDASKPLTHKALIEHELEGFGMRLNKSPPEITYKKKDKGGVNIVTNRPLTKLSEETIRAICKEYRVISADFIFRCDATEDEFIDVLEGNRVYLPCIYVMNKIDALSLEELELLDKVEHYCPLSGNLKWNLEGFLDKIWKYCDMIRVYTKPKGQDPDWTDPVVLPRNKRTVEAFCNRIHRNMIKSFKHAIVYGASAKHRPQTVGKDHILEDEDVVQIVKKV